MRVITATREAQLFLGKRGENLATQIQFPVVEQWTEQFGEGRFELAYQRPTEDAPYPCIVDVEDGNVLWNITDVELAIPGTGRAELFYIVDEAIAISVQYICRIADSLASGTPPEPWENWLEQILSAASDAEDARDEAVEASEDAVQAKTDAVDAKDLAVSSAESAFADAERAETARSYAEIANDAAQDAKTYAVDAKDVAVVASAEAIGAKEDALEASTDAINAASDAEAYMNVALGAKDDAEDARDSALGAVNDIANYANTASSAAATATEAATAATEAASTIDQVIPQHKGEYSATTTYVLNNIVTYQGATYWHYSSTETTGTAPTNTGYWVLVNSATKSIAFITKTGTAGLVDTYTITYTDNSTPSTFTVTNGQRGTQVTAGSSLPASGMITGDLFVKTPDLELYQYSGSAWTYVADLRTPVDATLSNQGEAADAKAVGDALETKADKDGYYEDLSVGRADNLISNIALTDEVPYSFRTAGGALEISDPIREKAIVGLTSVWYQRASLETSSAASADGWTRSNSTYMSLSLNEGTRTYTLSSDSNTSTTKNVRTTKEWITGGHIFLLCADIKASGTTGYISMGTNSASGTKSSPISSSATSFTHMATIARATADSTRLFLRITNGATSGSYAQFRDLQVFDLNRIFGKEVAEYLLARETASAGAGVEIFRSIFPNKYYTKDTGTWRSTMLSKKVSVGFNAYDSTTSKALVVGGHDYKIEGNYTSYTYTPFGGVAETILASDTNASERSYPFSGTLEFTGADSNLCVHLKWDGERDGEKEEYKAHEYALDEVELKGFWDIDENGNIYAFGDTYYPEGSITRKVGTALVSSLDWSYDATLQVFFANIATMKMGGHLACLATYERYTEDTLTSDMPNKSYWNEDEVYTAHNIVIKNTSYTTVSAFTTALGAYTIYYELDTPTTESADPFTEIQRVDNWGTEQYVDYAVEHNTRDVSMPYGHITEYPQDLKAKVEVMPDAPETDGLYLLKRENGVNTYTPYEKRHLDVTMSQDANLNIQFNESWTDLWNAYQNGDEITILVDNITLDGVNFISAQLPCGGKSIENGNIFLVFYLYTYSLGNYALYLYDDGNGDIVYNLNSL